MYLTLYLRIHNFYINIGNYFFFIKLVWFLLYVLTQNWLDRQKKEKSRLKRVILDPRLGNISSHQSWQMAINSRGLNIILNVQLNSRDDSF